MPGQRNLKSYQQRISSLQKEQAILFRRIDQLKDALEDTKSLEIVPNQKYQDFVEKRDKVLGQ